MAHKHVAIYWLSIAAALSPPTARVSQLAQRHAGVQPRVTRRSDGQTRSTHRRSTAGDDAQHALPRRGLLALAAFCAAPASAAESLRDALAARDANRLTKPFYNVPPGPTTKGAMSSTKGAATNVSIFSLNAWNCPCSYAKRLSWSSHDYIGRNYIGHNYILRSRP